MNAINEKSTQQQPFSWAFGMSFVGSVSFVGLGVSFFFVCIRSKIVGRNGTRSPIVHTDSVLRAHDLFGCYGFSCSFSSDYCCCGCNCNCSCCYYERKKSCSRWCVFYSRFVSDSPPPHLSFAWICLSECHSHVHLIVLLLKSFYFICMLLLIAPRSNQPSHI